MISFLKRCEFFSSLAACLNGKGQAVVEFTFTFVLLLAIAWIPADFGLAFYTGQLAQNASREGARIAAADRTLAPGSTNCAMPCAGATGVLKATADRMSSALLPGARLTLTLDPVPTLALPTCNQLVTVSISGPYNFAFYQLLRLLSFTVPNATTIARQTSMRWEHQC